MLPIQVWPWDEAPDHVRELSPTNDDVDWVAIVPPELTRTYIPWLESGTPFGVCNVFERPLENGSKLFVGVHA